jgi:deazaflavin-dependent oxidoreductase (nitroreductase family)
VNPRLWANRAHAWLLVAAQGKLGARVGGRPVLVLETHGRRSDRQRRTPVQYLRHGVELLIVASNAGHREPPAWSLNLQRQPTCRALVDGHWLDVHARFAKDEEHDQLSTLLAKGNPWLGKAAARAGRELAVIALSPSKDHPPS